SADLPCPSQRPYGAPPFAPPAALLPAALDHRTAALVAGLVEDPADMEPSSQYGPSPARIAVNSVQAQLDEIKLSVRTSESAWFGTLRAVALCTGLACASPFALSALATEVALPVLGAGLTLFVVSAEAQARTRAATSKVWAAEVSVVKATMEEMVAIACLFRARILAAAGFTAAAAVVAVVTESPWPLVAAYPRAGHVVQTCWQVLLAASCVGASVWCVGPSGVLVWAGRASKLSAQKLREALLDATRAAGKKLESTQPITHRATAAASKVQRAQTAFDKAQAQQLKLTMELERCKASLQEAASTFAKAEAERAALFRSMELSNADGPKEQSDVVELDKRKKAAMEASMHTLKATSGEAGEELEERREKFSETHEKADDHAGQAVAGDPDAVEEARLAAFKLTLKTECGGDAG
ncbi:unnamed protein product, partial [Prorocentrum cordatum]